MMRWLPELLFTNGRFVPEATILTDADGRISRIEPQQKEDLSQETAKQREVAKQIESTDQTSGALNSLKGRALLPGLVNAHSHAFQRVIRARTEYRTQNSPDNFWTWREIMYRAATGLTPEDVYDASRMAFMEMALSGITAVGEFHYLHLAPDGTPYDDPNLVAKEVVRAALDVGLRITLLRVAYARSGFKTEPNPLQQRFIEADPEIYLNRFEQLKSELATLKGRAFVGVAPHSVRAVPLNYLKQVIQFGVDQVVPIHMHVAEQSGEVSNCIEEYGRSPVALLSTEGLLSQNFTGVHVIHITAKAARMLAEARVNVCACPTTERNLGDGVVPADLFLAHGLKVSLGTDSNVQIDLIEDARELEYHLRLQKLTRVLLVTPDDEDQSTLAQRLFAFATINGAESIGIKTGVLEPGLPADFFTVELDDPSIAGFTETDLLSGVVFSLSRTAVRDVVVGGKKIVEEGRHFQQEEIVEKFKSLQRKLWS